MEVEHVFGVVKLGEGLAKEPFWNYTEYLAKVNCRYLFQRMAWKYFGGIVV